MDDSLTVDDAESVISSMSDASHDSRAFMKAIEPKSGRPNRTVAYQEVLATTRDIREIGCDRIYRPYEPKRPEQKTNEYFEEFMDLNYPGEGEFDWRRYYFDSPNADQLREHLTKFVVNQPKDLHGSRSLVRDTVGRLRARYSKLPRISNWLTVSNLWLVQFPKHTSPGVHYNQTLKRFTKKDAAKYALRDSAAKLRKLIDGLDDERFDRPSSLAARGRKIHTVDEGKNTTGRLILNVCMSQFLLASITSQPYLQVLRMEDKREGGVMIGLGPFHGMWNRLKESLEGATHYYSIDFSNFDSSIHPDIIGAAYDIIKDRFTDMPGKAAYFKQLRRNMTRTLILDPTGMLVRKSCGIASGDPFTSLIGSHCNEIYCETLINERFRPQGIAVKAFLFGDDSILAATCPPGVVPPTLGEVSAYLKHVFGADVSAKKSTLTECLTSVVDAYGGIRATSGSGESASFLSKYFSETGKPLRSIEDLLKAQATPEHYSGELWQAYAMAWSGYIEYYFNPSARDVMEKYLAWLARKFERSELDDNLEQVAISLAASDPAQAVMFRRLVAGFRGVPDEVKVLRLYYMGTTKEDLD